MNEANAARGELSCGGLTLRRVGPGDEAALLVLYGDAEAAWHFDGADCLWGRGVCVSAEQVRQLTALWQAIDAREGSVRWAVCCGRELLGMAEVRPGPSCTRVLRLDLRPCWEDSRVVRSVLHAVTAWAWIQPDCRTLLTRSWPDAFARTTALAEAGFRPLGAPWMGREGQTCFGYWCAQREENKNASIA